MRATSVPQRKSVPLPSKPKGGYQLIPVVHLALAWWAYHEKLIRLVDLRVWFAAWEMRARRCRSSIPLPHRFGLGEFQGLTGLSPRRLKESLRRLKAAGLLSWSESTVEFPASPDIVPLGDREGFRRFLDQIPNHKRLVPVPRRILRLLAGGARPALIATILGHLVRCLYLRGGKCLARGRVKASWIADVFGVSLRRVKHARKELIALGWLIPIAADQWELNRWGAHVRINLDWSRLDAIKGGGRPAPTGPSEGGCNRPDAPPACSVELAPPPPDSAVELTPPESDREPLQGDKNQKPAPGGPAGFFISDPEEQTPEPGTTLDREAPISQPMVSAARSADSENLPPPTSPEPRLSSTPPAKCPPLGPPDLRNVVPEDLRDTGRLLELYDQAVEAGLVTSSECDRLRFMAAAEHARVIGTRNPCGLFVRLVRGGLLHFATHDDETAASVRLRRHLYGGRLEPRAVHGSDIRPERQELSEDARLVHAVRTVAARARYQGDAFLLLKREKPEWTRERWDRAVAELGR